MVRWLVIGGVAVVALTIYALVDLFVTAKARVRAFPLAVWVGIIVVLPIIGPVLWLLIGKNRQKSTPLPPAPDDNPAFLGGLSESSEDRIQRLEEELRALDDEEDKSSEGGEDQAGEDGPPATPRA
jgi:hypothetical protein